MPMSKKADDALIIIDRGIIKVDVAIEEPMTIPTIDVNHNREEAKFISLVLTLSLNNAAVGGILAPHAAP